LQSWQRLDQPIDQALVEFTLAGERPIPGAQDAILERLELGRDVALGVLHGLPAHPVGRHLVRLAAADFDVVALHTVVAEAQVGEAGALTFARLELEQCFVAVLADAPQLVEIGVVA